MGIIRNLTDSKSVLNQHGSTDILIEVDDELRKRLQDTILGIYIDVAEVCRKYDLEMMLLGGSALGAVRHKGYIPWDDDLDIGMTRKSYNKFKEVFEMELGDKYILSAPNYKTPAKARFPKILKRGTVLEDIPDSRNKNMCKVYLDIFILDNTPDNVLHRKLKGFRCNVIEFIAGMVFFYENADEQMKAFFESIGKGSTIVRLLIGKAFSYRSAEAWFNKVDRAIQFDDDNSKCVTIATGRKHYFGESLRRDELFPLTEGEFEGLPVPVFQNNDYYLRNLYGDYMTIPPVEKRERHFIRKLEL